MTPQEVLKAAQDAAWIACDPAVATPLDVEELGILAIRDLREAYAAGDGYSTTVALGIALGTHKAMVCREMFLDALDLFSRLNAASMELTGSPVLGTNVTYTEYVEAILAWFKANTED